MTTCVRFEHSLTRSLLFMNNLSVKTLSDLRSDGLIAARKLWYSYRIRERRSVVQLDSRLKKRNNIARKPRTDKKMSLSQMRSQLRNVGLELGANADSSASAPLDDSMTGTVSASASASSVALPVHHFPEKLSTLLSNECCTKCTLSLYEYTTITRI